MHWVGTTLAMSQIRDQRHLHLKWIFQRNRIQICWFQSIVFLKMFEAFPQLCGHVGNCYYSLIVYYLCVMFLLVISNSTWHNSKRHPIARTPMKWIKSIAVKTLLGRSLAGPAFWPLSPISFYFQEYQNKLGYHNSWDLHLMVLLELLRLEASWSNQWSSVNRREYYSVHSSSLTYALFLLNLRTPSATVMLVTFWSSKRCITWRLKSYLCDWLSSSNSKDEIEGHGQEHGTRQSDNVAADSNIRMS